MEDPDLPNPMPIKIDLKNLPAAPFDLPHKCFELGAQLKVVATLLGKDEPWKIPDHAEPMSKVIAGRRAVPLVLAARALLGGEESPAGRALKAIPVATNDEREPELRHIWLRSLRDTVEQHERSIKRAMSAEYKEQAGPLIALAQWIEEVGMLFLRLQQAFEPNLLPQEIEVGE